MQTKTSKYERSRCCGNSGIKVTCGIPECTGRCHNLPIKKYGHINVTQNNAFFHETSGRQFLNFREACAVESLAHNNPNLTVHLLMTGQNVELNSPTMKTLRQYYNNIRITNINLDDYIVDSQLERWYFCTTWKNGSYAVSHLSDALRFLTLSKFGGYYFDLDIIHFRPVTSYRNFVVEEYSYHPGSSVIHVNYELKSIMETAVKEFAATYR